MPFAKGNGASSNEQKAKALQIVDYPVMNVGCGESLKVQVGTGSSRRAKAHNDAIPT